MKTLLRGLVAVSLSLGVTLAAMASGLPGPLVTTAWLAENGAGVQVV